MYSFIKRLGDLFLALLVTLILLPLFIPLFIILKLTGEGHIFYLQERIGYKNERFNIMKFATMLLNSPNMGTGMITLRKDPRITPAGHFLRKTKLNELPQVFNVLKGDMSIVGPRPLVKKNFDTYPDGIREHVYDSKPGITGIGSIIFRDEEKLISESDMDPHAFYAAHIGPYKGALEIWYNKNQSFLTDFKIIFLTAWYILFSESNLAFKWFKGLPEKPKELNG